MPHVAINGTELFHCEVGTGLPCLVMHGGLGVDHSQFHDDVDPLGDTLRLVYYDHRGNGRSGRPPIATLTIPQLVADADGLRAHLGHERIAVMGHSWGGCLALAYALRYPERVSHLLLVGTTAAWDHLDELAAALQRRSPSARLLEALLEVKPDPAAFAADQEIVATSLGFHRGDADRVRRMFRDTVWSPAGNGRSKELTPEFDVVPRLPEIDVPTLILVGGHDFFCPPAQAERLRAGIRRSELVVFEQSGHYPFAEEPAAFRKAVRAWVGSVGPRSSSPEVRERTGS